MTDKSAAELEHEAEVARANVATPPKRSGAR
jgi:hypothetical protein